jgi:hypothetical protein
VLLLYKRYGPCDQRRDKQQRNPGENGAQPSRVVLGVTAARIEKPPLGRAQLIAALPSPLERAGESRATVEVARIATCCIPSARAAGEMYVQPPPGTVLLEPGPIAWPLAQQRLV